MNLLSICRHRLLAAIIGVMAVIGGAHAAMNPVRNDADWLDAEGKPFTAQGGSLLKVGKFFYYYGMDGSFSNTVPWTVKCYSSTDLAIAELSPDFSRIGRMVALIKDVKLEAPSLFKRNGKYFFFASHVNWWYSSGTVWSSAERLEGPWSPFKPLLSPRPVEHPMARQMLRDSYNTQHDFVFRVSGSKGEFNLYCADRWTQFSGYGRGNNVWLPLEFQGDVPVLDWHQAWWIDVENGTWSAVEASK